MKKATLCVSSPLRSHDKGGHIVDSELTHSSGLNSFCSPSSVLQHHDVLTANVSALTILENVHKMRVKIPDPGEFMPPEVPRVQGGCLINTRGWRFISFLLFCGGKTPFCVFL